MTPDPRPPICADDETAGWSAVRTAREIAEHSVKPEEVLEAAISRAEDFATELGALTTPAFDQAREALDGHDGHGSLFGVPTAVKDLSEQAGIRTTFGTLAAGAHISSRTSGPVAQLLATGMISLGKSAAPEYGMTPTAETRGFTPTRNPWNLAHSCGGSSSGAGALVAARIVPIAHGSDGGGSVRIPAACCGLVGLKPTYGRLVEDEAMWGLPVKLVSHGVLTRTVQDTAAYLAAAEQVHAHPRLPLLGEVDGPSPRRRRIGVVMDSPVGPVDPEVGEATRRAADQLAELGHHVEEIDPPFGEGLAEDFLAYWGLLALGIPLLGLREVGLGYKPWRLDPWTKGLAGHARRNLLRMPGVIRRLRAFAGSYARTMAGWDVVVTPTLGILPPELGWLDVRLPFEEHYDRASRFVPFTPAWNVSGAPAITLPLALSRAGLPIGVQLGGSFGDDRTLLELAHELEASAGFNQPLG